MLVAASEKQSCGVWARGNLAVVGVSWVGVEGIVESDWQRFWRQHAVSPIQDLFYNGFSLAMQNTWEPCLSSGYGQIILVHNPIGRIANWHLMNDSDSPAGESAFNITLGKMIYPASEAETNSERCSLGVADSPCFHLSTRLEPWWKVLYLKSQMLKASVSLKKMQRMGGSESVFPTLALPGLRLLRG